MSLLPLITYQSRTSTRGPRQAAHATDGYTAPQQGSVALQGYCLPCIAGIMVCCELSGLELKCSPRPC